MPVIAKKEARPAKTRQQISPTKVRIATPDSSALSCADKQFVRYRDIETVTEETSAREANLMLRAGWVLLLTVAAHDGTGSYPCYVLGLPREAR